MVGISTCSGGGWLFTGMYTMVSGRNHNTFGVQATYAKVRISSGYSTYNRRIGPIVPRIIKYLRKIRKSWTGVGLRCKQKNDLFTLPFFARGARNTSGLLRTVMIYISQVYLFHDATPDWDIYANYSILGR